MTDTVFIISPDELLWILEKSIKFPTVHRQIVKLYLSEK